jgi:hypothetical protein
MEDEGILGGIMKATRILIFAVLMIVFLPTICFAVFLGPYSGTVIDSQTGEPIEGASVLVYWTKGVLYVFKMRSEVIEAKLVYTDKKGTYHISRFVPNLGLSGVLESTQIIIYEPGYQAYITEIHHNSPGRETDESFKVRDDIIKLDRIPPNFSHREHYEKIERSLWGLRENDRTDPISGKPLSWEKRMELSLKGGILEKEELLRRAEWEENR